MKSLGFGIIILTLITALRIKNKTVKSKNVMEDRILNIIAVIEILPFCCWPLLLVKEQLKELVSKLILGTKKEKKSGYFLLCNTPKQHQLQQRQQQLNDDCSSIVVFGFPKYRPVVDSHLAGKKQTHRK